MRLLTSHCRSAQFTPTQGVQSNGHVLTTARPAVMVTDRTISSRQRADRCTTKKAETDMAGRVEGKVAFITGAARGQGRSHAVRLAEEGADIIAIDVCEPISSNRQIPAPTPDDLAETADLVKSLNRRVVTAEVDVREFAALKAA